MVQIVCDVVAFTALGEAGHHAGRMRYAMAARASRDHLVLVLVAGYAQYSFMLCFALCQKLRWFLVTGSTHFVGCIRSHIDGGRHVGIVALLAIGCSNISAMRLVALGTERFLAVNIVTERASQLSMLARRLLKLSHLLGMAGQTLIGDIVSQLDDLRCMRIGVAAQTIFQFVVRLVDMALTAKGNIFFDCRTVTGVTVLTTHTGFVCSPVSGDIRRLGIMTLVTVSAAQGYFLCGAGNGRHRNGKCSAQQYYAKL